MTTTHDLIDNEELADILKRPVATIRYWKHVGYGPPSFKVGRRVMYRRADVETWLNQLEAV